MTTFRYASDQSLMVYLAGTGRGAHLAPEEPGGAVRCAGEYFKSDQTNLDTHYRVLKLLRLLEAEPIPSVRNLHPAYQSILIVFDPLTQDHAHLERILTQYVARLDSVALPEPRIVEIPVHYGGEHGPDLADLAALHGLTPDRVIALHSAASYIVYFVGFVPGFAYLGGLPPELATPRLESPRKRVPKGSVAIGGTHTGVYPFETPGGWRLIGRTPLEIFDPDSRELSRLRIGDRVRFTPAAIVNPIRPASAT